MSPSDFLDKLMGRTSGYDARIRPNFKGTERAKADHPSPLQGHAAEKKNKISDGKCCKSKDGLVRVLVIKRKRINGHFLQEMLYFIFVIRPSRS